MKKISNAQYFEYQLLGTNCLHVLVFDDRNRLVDVKDFTLKEISLEELSKHRANPEKAGFVMKMFHKCYYTPFPNNFTFSEKGIRMPLELDVVRFHTCDTNCNYSKSCDCDFLKNLKEIEKYSFIHFGFESFNTIEDKVFVHDCRFYYYYR